MTFSQKLPMKCRAHINLVFTFGFRKAGSKRKNQVQQALAR